MATKGNNPELWERLLSDLDEKLQLALLDRLRRVKVYHIEDNTLMIEAGTAEDEQYLMKDSVSQQLELLAQQSISIEKVKINPYSSEN